MSCWQLPQYGSSSFLLFPNTDLTKYMEHRQSLAMNLDIWSFPPSMFTVNVNVCTTNRKYLCERHTVPHEAPCDHYTVSIWTYYTTKHVPCVCLCVCVWVCVSMLSLVPVLLCVILLYPTVWIVISEYFFYVTRHGKTVYHLSNEYKCKETFNVGI